ncbi:MAG: bifunctional alpha,alpha-trehalose-phosphate synthase (UDP-forming)/trehalose-phosphatase [bacterium]|nr:bifunctional alpha,alpha-trehalose-phosphate synthase (UDP-forming)/trehalose-phosphatase [bacterium]
MSSTIIVSNRLPVSIKKTDVGLEVYPSAGGLATGLSSYASQRGNLWIGWPGIVNEELTDDDQQEIINQLKKYNCQPVFLSKKQIDQFYNGYSNSILWPFLHTMEADFNNEERDWKTYRKVNEMYQEAVLSLSSPGSTIWVHDYQLMLLPKLLREQRPTDNIGFFLHIPFPSSEHFAGLRQAIRLIHGILGADLVGFHTKNYAQNFLESAYLLTHAAPIEGGVALKTRAVRIADFPIGIDYVKFSNASRQRAVQRELQILERQYKNQRIVLTVDRLDPTKGFLERLQAFDTFLHDSPQLHGRVTMIMLAVPSRGEIAAYKNLKSDVENMVDRINDIYSTADWQPIDYIYTSVPFERLSALYQLAEIAFVAPLRDGMNLVAKEYVASQGKNKGILILSETAGAAQELQSALLVNPNKPKSLVSALKQAIKMPTKELKQRASVMRKTLSTNTIHYWAGDFLGTLNKPIPTPLTPPLTKLRQKNLVSNYQSASKRLLLFDYDGVLAPFKDNPARSKPTVAIRDILENLANSSKNTVIIISGRHKDDLQKWLGDLPIVLVAEHGAVIRRSKAWRKLLDTDKKWQSKLLPLLDHHADEAPGAFVEVKDYSLVWHYRAASPYHAQKNIAILKKILKPLLKKYGLVLSMGNKILEIRDPHITKGRAVKKLLDKPYDFMLAFGDDYTDEEMFRALPKRAFSIKVGHGITKARYRLRSISRVREFLQDLTF